MKKPYKILAINGSHRSKRGISELLLQKFIQGSRMAGAEYEILYPGEMEIGPCRACYNCIVKSPGICIQKDDMGEIIRQMQAADLLLLAAPVYFDTMPSNLMRLFERLMPTLGPVFEFKDGRTYHLTTDNKIKKMVTILLCGNPERESLASIQGTFRRIVKNMGGRLMGEFLFPSSQMAIDDAQHLAGQLTALEKAGNEAVRYDAISKETLTEANREYISDYEADILKKNQVFAEMMRQNDLMTQ